MNDPATVGRALPLTAELMLVEGRSWIFLGELLQRDLRDERKPRAVISEYLVAYGGFLANELSEELSRNSQHFYVS